MIPSFQVSPKNWLSCIKYYASVYSLAEGFKVLLLSSVLGELDFWLPRNYNCIIGKRVEEIKIKKTRNLKLIGIQ